MKLIISYLLFISSFIFSSQNYNYIISNYVKYVHVPFGKHYILSNRTNKIYSGDNKLKSVLIKDENYYKKYKKSIILSLFNLCSLSPAVYSLASQKYSVFKTKEGKIMYFSSLGFSYILTIFNLRMMGSALNDYYERNIYTKKTKYEIEIKNKFRSNSIVPGISSKKNFLNQKSIKINEYDFKSEYSILLFKRAQADRRKSLKLFFGGFGIYLSSAVPLAVGTVFTDEKNYGAGIPLISLGAGILGTGAFLMFKSLKYVSLSQAKINLAIWLENKEILIDIIKKF